MATANSFQIAKLGDNTTKGKGSAVDTTLPTFYEK